MNDCVGSPELLKKEDRRFCSMEEIMRKIVPSSMKIDDRARQLIEKCVTEFACSITNIAAGYCSLEQPSANSVVSSGQRPADVPGELKSEHIIRSLENMGYSEYSKPLATFKHVQKAKMTPQLPKYTYVEPSQAKKQKVVHGSAVPVSGPTLTTTASAARVTMPVPTTAVAKAIVNRGNLTPAQAFKQQQQELVDQYLRSGSQQLSVADIARKFGVSNGIVSKRVQAMKEQKVEMKGIKLGYHGIHNRVAVNSGVAPVGAIQTVPTGTSIAAVPKDGAPSVTSSASSQAVVLAPSEPTVVPQVDPPQLAVPASVELPTKLTSSLSTPSIAPEKV